MTDRVAAEFEAHPAFDRDGDSFVASTTAVEARVEGASTTADEVAMIVRVPTIDAVVAGESVAPVVREGWFETFERRLEDVGGVTRRETPRPTARLDESGAEVVVETALPVDPAGVADDAKAVVDYVEGTFVEGLIPGYTYREPAAGLLARARTAGER